MISGSECHLSRLKQMQCKVDLKSMWLKIGSSWNPTGESSDCPAIVPMSWLYYGRVGGVRCSKSGCDQVCRLRTKCTSSAAWRRSNVNADFRPDTLSWLGMVTGVRQGRSVHVREREWRDPVFARSKKRKFVLKARGGVGCASRLETWTGFWYTLQRYCASFGLPSKDCTYGFHSVICSRWCFGQRGVGTRDRTYINDDSFELSPESSHTQGREGRLCWRGLRCMHRRCRRSGSRRKDALSRDRFLPPVSSGPAWKASRHSRESEARQRPASSRATGPCGEKRKSVRFLYAGHRYVDVCSV